MPVSAVACHFERRARMMFHQIRGFSPRNDPASGVPPGHFSGSGGAFSRASACPLLSLGVNLSYNGSMELTLQLQLLPAADQRPVLLATMERFHEAATFAAKVGFEAGVFSQPSIHHMAKGDRWT